MLWHTDIQNGSGQVRPLFYFKEFEANPSSKAVPGHFIAKILDGNEDRAIQLQWMSAVGKKIKENSVEK